ncbi:MAG: serine hydrolase [Salinarimonas sp.]|nr:serine hydrolase [Salinarimonas sp.]
MDLMSGFPPKPEHLVTLANWRKPPFNRWSFHHVCELVPSASISHADRPAMLPQGEVDLGELVISHQGRKLDLRGWLEETFTDSMVILRRGKVVFETYSEGQDARTRHIWMSVSKSVLGLIAGILENRGSLNVDAPVTDIIPEVRGSAFDGATIRDLLDMRVGILFDEDYNAADGTIIDYRKSHLWDPREVGETPTDLRSFLATLDKRDGQHNARFHYVSPNTDLMGWVIERAGGMRYADLVSELLWKPLGAATDAYITVDRFGAPRCAGGLCATPRDMALLGRLFATGGKSADGEQIVPESWLSDILENGDPQAWADGDFYELFGGADMHYRSKWYVQRGERPLVFGLGVFGQNLVIDPQADLVIAKASSQPVALDTDYNALSMAGLAELVTSLG